MTDIVSQLRQADALHDLAVQAEGKARQALDVAEVAFVAAHGRFKAGDSIDGFKTRILRGGVAQKMRVTWVVRRFHVTVEQDGILVSYTGKGSGYKCRLSDFHGFDGKVINPGMTQEGE